MKVLIRLLRRQCKPCGGTGVIGDPNGNGVGCTNCNGSGSVA